MKNLTIKTTGEYTLSNTTFTGSRKQVINYLRTEAKRMRRESRISRHLEDCVHAINESLHASKLVTMASYELNNCGLEKLLELINNHGVIKYSIN